MSRRRTRNVQERIEPIWSPRLFGRLFKVRCSRPGPFIFHSLLSPTQQLRTGTTWPHDRVFRSLFLDLPFLQSRLPVFVTFPLPSFSNFLFFLCIKPLPYVRPRARRSPAVFSGVFFFPRALRCFARTLGVLCAFSSSPLSSRANGLLPSCSPSVFRRLGASFALFNMLTFSASIVFAVMAFPPF